MPRRLAAISVDLDGFPGMYRTRNWSAPPGMRDLNAVYSDALPRFLDLFAEEGVQTTLFVVGEDAANPANRAVLARAAREGHELANHSMRHLHLPTLPIGEAEREVVEAEEAIGAITGRPPRGFRSPAWMPTEPLLDLLARRGYRYDASVFPTPWLSAWRSLRARRVVKGPEWPWAFAPRGPALLSREAGPLWEVPAATLPLVRVPVWGTILHWLGPELFRPLTRLCGIGAPVSMVLHGWELVDFDLIGDPRFLEKPGIERPFGAREQLLRESLRWMKAHWELLPIDGLLDRLEPEARGAA